MSDKQIVVFKGNMGFCDRLQVLSHCMHYCLIHKATLCVDWRDELWGQNIHDFHDYFELINIDTISINEVSEIVKNGASVFPSIWTSTDIAEPPNPITRLKSYNFTFDPNYSKVNGSVIIVNCTGNRTYHIDNLILNIRLKKEISDVIINRIDNNLTLPFTAIHLRGTDRLGNKSIENAVESAVNKFNKLPEYAKTTSYVFSDMSNMISLWKNKFPQTNVLIHEYAIGKIIQDEDNCIGIHKMDEQALNFFSVKKHDINIDTITDFVALSFAKWIVGNNDESIFTKLAKFMSNVGVKGISKWLHGYEPKIKTNNIVAGI